MKHILLILMLLIPGIPGVVYGSIYNDDMIDRYIIEETFFNIVAQTHYESFYYEQSLEKFKKTMIGDCTEMAALSIDMLKQYDFRCRELRGYLPGRVKHDGFECKISSGQWYNPHDRYKIKIKWVGKRFW